MDAGQLLKQVQESTYPQGIILVHVVDRHREYWLEVLDVCKTTETQMGWVNGAVIETKSIPEGPRASRAIGVGDGVDGLTLHQAIAQRERQAIADLACKSPEQIAQMEADGTLNALYGHSPNSPSDLAEPHYDLVAQQALEDLDAEEKRKQ